MASRTLTAKLALESSTLVISLCPVLRRRGIKEHDYICTVTVAGGGNIMGTIASASIFVSVLCKRLNFSNVLYKFFSSMLVHQYTNDNCAIVFVYNIIMHHSNNNNYY